MKSFLYHLQINIDFKNVSFYKDLMSFLNWSVIFEDKNIIGYKSNQSGDLWFVKSNKKRQTDYDCIGVNHISIRVGDLDEVDQAALFIQKKNVNMLFNTPRHRPEFVSTPTETYYQIMFTSPDNILFEIVYIGIKS